jgi:hypothetical protein
VTSGQAFIFTKNRPRSHLWPGTALPADDLLSTLLYQQLTITLNGIQASIGYQQVYLPAARVEPGSLTRHGDHQDIRIVPGRGAGAVIRYAQNPPPRRADLGDRPQ